MKTLVSKISLIAALGWLFFIFSSCGKCSGCDEIVTTEGANLELNDSASRRAKHLIELSVRVRSSTAKGDRNCMYKNLIVCTNDELSVDLITVQCSKDLKLRTETILAGKNLLELASKEPNLNNPYWNGNLAVELPLSDTFATGDYTFILSGKTKDGKPVNDTAVIIW